MHFLSRPACHVLMPFCSQRRTYSSVRSGVNQSFMSVSSFWVVCEYPPKGL